MPSSIAINTTLAIAGEMLQEWAMKRAFSDVAGAQKLLSVGILATVDIFEEIQTDRNSPLETAHGLAVASLSNSITFSHSDLIAEILACRSFMPSAFPPEIASNRRSISGRSRLE